VYLRLSLCLVLYTASICSAQTDPPVIAPADWKRIDVGPFSFFAPADVHDAPLPGIAEDSYVREFAGQHLVFHFDYGRWSNDLSYDYPSFQAHQEVIGGKPAKVVSFTAPPAKEFRYENFRAVYFADTGKPNMRLTMTASCDGASSCQEAVDIFRTLRFR
jgi:hypothetical protein